MKRKWLAIGIILLLAGTCSIPAHKIESNYNTSSRGGFGLQSIIQLSWWGNETQEPLIPGGASRNVTLNITYYTTLITPYLGRIVLLYCLATHQHVMVTLKIGEIPTWCSASLSSSEFQFPITGIASSQSTTVTVTVNEHAPAYELCSIPVNASINTIQGPFGILPFVNGCEQTAILSVLPGYRPDIIVTPASEYLNATPGHPSILPITITNTGNARTIVFADIIDFPSGNWVIAITTPIIIDVNMTSYTYLSVRPPSDFNGTETITISFTPCMADDPTQCGEPVYITITVICEP